MKEKFDPIELFAKWYKKAKEKETLVPDAVCLATASKSGRPSSRMVLLKHFDDNGFVFYTNLKSQKSTDLIENPQASLCFHWKNSKQQIRVEGEVTPVSKEEADEYFATRAKKSQLGAWASKQSQIMSNKLELEKSIAKWALEFGISDIPRPDFWSGYRVHPDRIEFWEDRSFRLHDRFQFVKKNGEWDKEYLFP